MEAVKRQISHLTQMETTIVIPEGHQQISASVQNFSIIPQQWKRVVLRPKSCRRAKRNLKPRRLPRIPISFFKIGINLRIWLELNWIDKKWNMKRSGKKRTNCESSICRMRRWLQTRNRRNWTGRWRSWQTALLESAKCHSMKMGKKIHF